MSRAHTMVWRLGMGSNGFVGDYEVLLSSSQFRGSGSGDRLSESMKERLNNETHLILKNCTEEVEVLLRKEDAVLTRFAEELLKREELEFDDIEAIFAEFGKKSGVISQNPSSSTPPAPPSAPPTQA